MKFESKLSRMLVLFFFDSHLLVFPGVCGLVCSTSCANSKRGWMLEFVCLESLSNLREENWRRQIDAGKNKNILDNQAVRYNLAELYSCHKISKCWLLDLCIFIFSTHGASLCFRLTWWSLERFLECQACNKCLFVVLQLCNGFFTLVPQVRSSQWTDLGMHNNV